MAYECKNDSDQKLCMNELKTKFNNNGYKYVTFEDLNNSQKKRVQLNCQNFKKRGLISYNNCLNNQKEIALKGELSKPKRAEIPKSNIAELFQSFFYLAVFDSNEKLLGTGSGVAIANNLIATNCHVVAENGVKIIDVYNVNTKKEKFTNPLQANVMLYKVNLAADICILKLKKNNLKAVKLRSYKDLKIGEFVRAIGNPIGIIGHTSTGEINTLKIFPFEKNSKKIKQIVHDATIGSGSSGGPLFDFRNQLIGINTAGFSTTDQQTVGGAINIAVSSDYIKDLLD